MDETEYNVPVEVIEVVLDTLALNCFRSVDNLAGMSSRAYAKLANVIGPAARITQRYDIDALRRGEIKRE